MQVILKKIPQDVFISISALMSDNLWQRDACEQFGMAVFFPWYRSFWRRTAGCRLAVNWPALSWKYLNEMMRLMEVWRDVNPDGHSWWCIGYGCSCSDKNKCFWCICQQTQICSKLNCNSTFRNKPNRPLLLDILKWYFGCLGIFLGFFWYSFYLDLVRGSSNGWWLRMMNGLNISR